MQRTVSRAEELSNERARWKSFAKSPNNKADLSNPELRTLEGYATYMRSTF